jgi:broad specificity phosphatase PhoE
MKVVLIRHFRVGFRWKFFYNSSEYEVDCGGYNSAEVIRSDLSMNSDDRLISSTMPRALETSRHIFNRDPDHADEVLCEVPIKPFTRTSIRLPKIVWDIIGRLQWRFNLSPQPETFSESKKRVRRFVDSLLAENRNVVIVCHGWIIKLIISRLRARGFRGPNPIYIRNGVPYEYVLTDTRR